MKSGRKALIVTILLVFCLIIHFYSANEARVESGYSSGFFISFSHFLRRLFGWMPFSIGDILYGLLVIWLIAKLFKFLSGIFKKKAGLSKKIVLTNALYKGFVFCACIYIIFNLFWGINYNRKGIAWQLNLEMKKYSTEDLVEINNLLVAKINAEKNELLKQKTNYPSSKALFGLVNAAYKNVERSYPFLNYEPASIKSSMWGWLGNYTGFTGYYNPFTGEAQLNTTIPKFLQPFVACHEVAHQIGYAKEMEANFVGYLAAANSGNSLLKYSVYLDMFTYANRNLFFADSAAAKMSRKSLSTEVMADLKEWSDFNKSHQSIAEPVVRWIYGIYLQGNRQPGGILSYDEVTGFIIAYYKKFGRI